MANESIRQLADTLRVATAQLSGDPRRLQLALGQVEERKRKEEEEARRAAILNAASTNPELAKFTKLLGAFKGAEAYVTRPSAEDKTEFERSKAEYLALQNIPLEKRTSTQNRDISILEVKLYGQPKIIPVFTADGEVAPQAITTRDLSKDPNILKRLEEQGLYTIGQKPSLEVKGAKKPINQIRQSYLDTKGQVDTYNDLATIIFENRNAFSLAGSIASLVNDTRYQAKSALQLAQFDKFVAENPEEYKELETFLDKEYGENLDKLSQDRAVARSLFLRLAYGTAKEIDPSGRLSDNDVKIAMDIIGKLGANYKANLATLQNLYDTTVRSYNDRLNIRTKQLTKVEDQDEVADYVNLPQFLGGRNWQQITDQEPNNNTSERAQELVNKYNQP